VEQSNGNKWRMRLFGSRRRKVVSIAGIIMAMLVGGVAGAIFAGVPIGIGTQPASVGTNAANVTVTVTGSGDYAPGGGTATALQPDTVAPNIATDTGNGSDLQVIYWTVTPSAAAVIQTATATPASDGNGNAVGPNDAVITGCSASWFVVSAPMVTNAGNTTLAQDIAGEHALVGTALAASTPVTVFATVYLYDSTGTTIQNACESSTPDIQLSIN
jgi:hypothetical protein